MSTHNYIKQMCSKKCNMVHPSNKDKHHMCYKSCIQTVSTQRKRHSRSTFGGNGSLCGTTMLQYVTYGLVACLFMYMLTYSEKSDVIMDTATPILPTTAPLI